MKQQKKFKLHFKKERKQFIRLKSRKITQQNCESRYHKVKTVEKKNPQQFVEDADEKLSLRLH